MIKLQISPNKESTMLSSTKHAINTLPNFAKAPKAKALQKSSAFHTNIDFGSTDFRNANFGGRDFSKSIFCLLLTMCLALFGLSSCSSETNPNSIESIKKRGVLIVGVLDDVPHLGLLNRKNEKIEGYEIDISKALAKEILGDESKLKLVALNYKSRQPLLENGSVDLVIATFSITDERKKTLHFSKPYYVDSVGILVLKDKGYKSLADMSDAHIGVAQSSTTREVITTAAKKEGIEVKFSEFAEFSDIKAALDSDKIDAFCIDKSILLGYVDSKSEILPDSFETQRYGIASKKSNTSLANVVDEFMENNGELLENLAKKWNLK